MHERIEDKCPKSLQVCSCTMHGRHVERGGHAWLPCGRGWGPLVLGLRALVWVCILLVSNYVHNRNGVGVRLRAGLTWFGSNTNRRRLT